MSDIADPASTPPKTRLRLFVEWTLFGAALLTALLFIHGGFEHYRAGQAPESLQFYVWFVVLGAPLLGLLFGALGRSARSPRTFLRWFAFGVGLALGGEIGETLAGTRTLTRTACAAAGGLFGFLLAESLAEAFGWPDDETNKVGADA